MLPQIQRYARSAFRHLPSEARDEAVQEVIAASLITFARLFEQGRHRVASAASLARFAVKRFKSGREVGCRLNSREVLSRYARLRNGFSVQRLNPYCRTGEHWIDLMVQDRRAPVPDVVVLRIDVPAWLKTLSRRDRRIAADLAQGWRTGEVAKRHSISAGRVSQIRSELYRSWTKFSGDGQAADAACG